MNIKTRAYQAYFVTVIALAISSCEKERITPAANAYGKLEVNISNEVDGAAISFGAMPYTNAAGNKYGVDLLKYYVSNFTLIRDDGSQKNFGNYNLIDASDSTKTKFVLDSVGNGNYTSIKFLLGVDKNRNHTGAQDGDLDPVKGMIWSWNTGYLFFKHEGGFKDSTGVDNTLAMHYGTDTAATTITLSVSPFEVKGNTRKLYLKFNLNKLYASPNLIDFNGNNVRQSTDPSDALWISHMKGNFPSAFLFDKVL
jgi:hypothetical protein